ncbi:MAG: hypothetical protein KF805_10055 [Phycisphaeraceae bacterium]|nr:hypothetical protein [Phycisphaeraceae bacterium]
MGPVSTSRKEASKKTAVVWLRPDQVSLAHDVAAACNLTIEAVGSPTRGESTALAQKLLTEPADDLRSVLVETKATVVLLFDPGDFGKESEPADDRALAAAKSRGVRIASLEPIPASALALQNTTSSDEQLGSPESFRLLTLFRHSKRYRDAHEVIEQFGHVRTLSLEFYNSPEQGSLGAQLVSALDAVVSHLGTPETVDASFVSPAQGQSVYSVPGETLRGFSGDLTAVMRFSDGRTATIVASDHAGRWNRVLTLLGPAGRLRIYDDGFEFLGPAGEKIDEARHRRTVKSPPHSVEILGDGINRLLDSHIPAPTPMDMLSVLSTAQAALLSTRTGQPESPDTIRRMVSRE